MSSMRVLGRQSPEGTLAEAVQIITGEIIGLTAEEQALFSAPGVAERAQAALPVVVQEAPELNRPFEDALLEKLSMPVLVLHGERSRIEFKHAARDLSERLADGRLTEIAGAGHVGPLMAPNPSPTSWSGSSAAEHLDARRRAPRSTHPAAVAAEFQQSNSASDAVDVRLREASVGSGTLAQGAVPLLLRAGDGARVPPRLSTSARVTRQAGR